jgi:hypothetical protein
VCGSVNYSRRNARRRADQGHQIVALIAAHALNASVKLSLRRALANAAGDDADDGGNTAHVKSWQRDGSAQCAELGCAARVRRADGRRPHFSGAGRRCACPSMVRPHGWSAAQWPA